MTSATRTCRASSRRPSAARPGRTSPTRSTTCRSSACVHPDRGPGFDLWRRRWAVHEPDDRPARSVSSSRSRRSPRSGPGHRQHLPRLRLPAAAPPRAHQVPGRRLGSASASVSCWRARPTSVAPSPTVQPRRRPRGAATTSASTRRRTACSTSGSRRPVGRVSGTTLARIADLAEAAGSDRVRTTVEQKMVILDVPPTASTRWSPGSPSWDCPWVRPCSAAAPWPALASSSASWRSSRPRRGPPSSSASSRSGCRRSTSRSASTSTAARTRARAPRWPTSASRASS